MRKRAKKGKRNGGTVSRLLSGRDIPVTFTGKTFLDLTTSATPLTPTSIQLSVAPSSLGSRLSNLGNVYQEFHFNRIEIKIHPPATAAGVRTSAVVAYSKIIGILAGAISFASMYEFTASRFISATDTVPMLLNMGPDVLRSGARVWYICNTVLGTETEDQAQGVIFVNSDVASSVVRLEVGYSITFRGATNPETE